MAFEPVDWELVSELYQQPMIDENDDDGGLSLRDVARGGSRVFSGRSLSTSWLDYETWLDDTIMRGVNGSAAGDDDDGVRTALVSHAIRDALGVALVLGFVEEV